MKEKTPYYTHLYNKMDFYCCSNSYMHMDAFMCSKHKIEGMHERLHVDVKVELLFNLCMFSDFKTQIILVMSVSISDRNDHIFT